MTITRGNFSAGLMINGNLVVGSPMSTTGNVFFVKSTGPNAADDPGHGKSPSKPFATIDYAVGQCTASNNDFIWVMPGHVETVRRHLFDALTEEQVAQLRMISEAITASLK